MENEDVILDEMENTRTALTDKLETLESQVASTVQGATSNVADTIEAVRETVDAVKDSVEEAVTTAKETFAEAVTSAKEAVQDSVTAVKSLVDVPGWVRAYPWPSFGVSIAAGFAMERLLAPVVSEARGSFHNHDHRFPPDHVSGEATYNGVGPSRSFVMEALHSLEPEIQQLKGLALGKLMETIEQLVGDALPAEMAPKAKNIFHGITRKIGGDVTHEEHELRRTSTELA